EAFRRGCRFDAWTEHLKWDTWMEVFSDHGIDPERYLAERSTEAEQPWDVVQSPVTRKFLVREKLRADRAAITDDCRLEDVCFSCGVVECPQRPWVKRPHPALDATAAQAQVRTGNRFGRRKNGVARAPRVSSHANGGRHAPLGVATSTRFRIQFEKGPSMRFTSHLDLMRAWERALRRSELPLAFTQGHHPHLKMSFGPPLPLGYRSRAEVFDLELSRPPAVDLLERLNDVLPEGLRVNGFRPILFKIPSLMSQLDGATYRVRFPATFLEQLGSPPDRLLESLSRGAAELLDRPHVIVRRKNEDQTREFDARPSIVALEASAEEPPAVLEAHLRFTPRAAARPEELLGFLLPACDVRAADIERIALWAEVGERRFGPFELLSGLR
ncbi:MAG: DUF2344 domain-containing protein, partial [Candidatus Eisenbacteria bacterium]